MSCTSTTARGRPPMRDLGKPVLIAVHWAMPRLRATLAEWARYRGVDLSRLGRAA